MKGIKFLAAGALLFTFYQTAPSASGKSDYNVFGNGNETIYYPPGWEMSNGSLLGGVNFYSTYIWSDPNRPIGAKKWVDIMIRKIDPNGFELNRAPTMADYINDKRCDVPKCNMWSECPAHIAARELPTKLFKSCTPTRYPRLTGGVCGTYYERKKISGNYFYFFQDDTKTTSFSEPGEDLMEITAFFSKGGNNYFANLICSDGEYENYQTQFMWMLTNFTVKPPKKRL